MKSMLFHKRLGKTLIAIVTFASVMFAAASIAQEFAPGMEVPEASVFGPIQAVEEGRNSLIVEGRRFALAPRVRMDSVELSRSDALDRLSKGDSVMIVRESISQDVIHRIYTNLE